MNHFIFDVSAIIVYLTCVVLQAIGLLKLAQIDLTTTD